MTSETPIEEPFGAGNERVSPLDRVGRSWEGWSGPHGSEQEEVQLSSSRNYNEHLSTWSLHKEQKNNSTKSLSCSQYLSINGEPLRTRSAQPTFPVYANSVGNDSPASITSQANKSLLANSIVNQLRNNFSMGQCQWPETRTLDVLETALAMLGSDTEDIAAKEVDSESHKPGEGDDGRTLSNLRLQYNLGGRHYAAPAVLAHPDEFKNPSSFLKLYGDPQCVGQEKRASVDKFSGSGGCPKAGVKGNWKCTNCSNINFPRRFNCLKCTKKRTDKDDAKVRLYTLQVYAQLHPIYESMGKVTEIPLHSKKMQDSKIEGSMEPRTSIGGDRTESQPKNMTNHREAEHFRSSLYQPQQLAMNQGKSRSAEGNINSIFNKEEPKNNVNRNLWGFDQKQTPEGNSEEKENWLLKAPATELGPFFSAPSFSLDPCPQMLKLDIETIPYGEEIQEIFQPRNDGRPLDTHFNYPPLRKGSSSSSENSQLRSLDSAAAKDLLNELKKFSLGFSFSFENA